MASEARRPDEAGRVAGPDFAGRHILEHDRTHADDRTRADDEPLTHARARTHVGVGADVDAAGHAHAGAERDAVADGVVVGQHRARHHLDMTSETDVSGDDNSRRASPNPLPPRRSCRVGPRMHERGEPARGSSPRRATTPRRAAVAAGLPMHTVTATSG